MNKEELKICRRAVHHYGAQSQTDMMIEEMSELAQALMKHRREPWSLERMANVQEELADVEIMLAQMKMIYDPNNNCDAYKTSKLVRLNNRISGLPD